jgi:hypothetical protein
MVSTKTKYKTVAKTFGVPVDPEDVEYIDFMYAWRHLATVPDGNGRELAYVVELDDLSHAITTTLDRIRERDGEKIFREAASYLREAVDSASERRHRACCKVNGAAVHV